MQAVSSMETAGHLKGDVDASRPIVSAFRPVADRTTRQLPGSLFLLLLVIYVKDICWTAGHLSTSHGETYIKMLERMANESAAEYDVFCGYTAVWSTATTATRSVASGNSEAFQRFRFTGDSRISPISFVHSTRVAVEHTQATAASTYECSCGMFWDDVPSLRHRQQSSCTYAAIDPSMVQESEASELDEASAEASQSNVDSVFLQSCGELHYEHFVSTANTQRHKEACARVSAAQTKAIKKALNGKLVPGVDLDSIIGPIMGVADKFQHKVSERNAHLARFGDEFRVTPRRRSLGVCEDTGAEIYMYDVPLEESLQREAFYNPDFAAHLDDWGARPPHADKSLTSVQDGMVARDHPELGNPTYNGPKRLAFAHYYDDVEIVNPIGHARVKHKLGLHYAMVLNPPPHVRSALDVIFLVGVVLKTTQDQAGIQQVVQGPRDELPTGTSFGASLRRFHQQNGLTFIFPDGSRQAYRGWLLLVCADTLAAAELIGFKKSWGPKVKSLCWQCDAGRPNDSTSPGIDIPSSFLSHSQHACAYTARSSDQYREQRRHCRTLPVSKPKRSTDVTQAEFMSSIGVTTWKHAFTRIPYFDVIRNVPRDLMHIELEGNLKVHAYGFLYMAIKKHRWFTRAQLNQRISQFPFLHDRPPCIPKTSLKGRKGTLPAKRGAISMTSGQMLQFVIHSLEILRPLMSVNALSHSPLWAAWVAHVKYFSAMMKMHFTEQSIIDLDHLIWDAQTKFIGIVEYSGLWKPKNHFAQHIPGDILLYGPPRNFWCMRFEAKNQEHKRSAKLGDFKGVPKTVSEFWAIRSGLRLLAGKRKRSLAEPETDTGTITYNGMELTAGTWILHQDGDSQIISRIQSVYVIEGVPYANVRSYNCMSIMRKRSDDMPYASATTLRESGAMRSLAVHSTAMTVLLPIEYKGRVRFVEQV